MNWAADSEIRAVAVAMAHGEVVLAKDVATGSTRTILARRRSR